MGRRQIMGLISIFLLGKNECSILFIDDKNCEIVNTIQVVSELLKVKKHSSIFIRWFTPTKRLIIAHYSFHSPRQHMESSVFSGDGSGFNPTNDGLYPASIIHDDTQCGSERAGIGCKYSEYLRFLHLN